MFTTALAVALAAQAAAAFTITTPSSSQYWVACQNNTLAWTSNSTDAASFAVALIDTSNSPSTPSLVNGNYQIANGLDTSAGSAIIPLNCVTPSSAYQLLLVNASQYELNNPQVYFASSTFEIKAKGTPAAGSSDGTGTGAGSTGSSSGLSTSILPSATSSTSSTSAPSASSTANNSGSTGAASTALVRPVIGGLGAVLAVVLGAVALL